MEMYGRIIPPRIFPRILRKQYPTIFQEILPKKIKYSIFATEWSNPQKANTAIGNKTPSVVERFFFVAWFTDQTERVINNPQRIEEQRALIAQLFADSFVVARAFACGITVSAKGVK